MCTTPTGCGSWSRRRSPSPYPCVLLTGVHCRICASRAADISLPLISAEKKVFRFEKGKRVAKWEAGGRRNEALDCLVGALAMARIAQQHFGVDLSITLAPARPRVARGTRSTVR